MTDKDAFITIIHFMFITYKRFFDPRHLVIVNLPLIRERQLLEFEEINQLTGYKFMFKLFPPQEREIFKKLVTRELHKQLKNPSYKVFTDASHNHRTKESQVGMVLVNKDNKVIKMQLQKIGKQPNSYTAEYIAAQLAARFARSEIGNKESFVIYTDCKNLLNDNKLYSALKAANSKLVWIKREFNTLADKLSKVR